MAEPFPQSDFVIELSEDGVAWTDYSVHAATMTPSGGARTTGQFMTAGRDTPFVTAGKREAIEWTINVLYSTTTDSLYDKLRGYMETKTRIWIRYTPAPETAVDDTAFECGPGVVTNCIPPEADASSGEALATEATFYAETDQKVTVTQP